MFVQPEKEFWIYFLASRSVAPKKMVDTMLAEIFVLRLEAIARAARSATNASERFVRFDPGVPFEFKDSRDTRRPSSKG